MGTPLRTVLVTGGSGFIGRQVVARLRADGLEVLVLDVRANPVQSSAVGVSVFLADVRDERSVDAAIEHVDGVIHLAGISGNLDLATVVDHNLIGALNVLESAHRFQKPVVLATKVNAAVLIDPESILAQTVESFGQMYRGELESVVNVVRLADSYGPAPEIAQQRGIVAEMVREALAGDEIVVDSHRVVDPVHVRDVADVLADALWYGAEVGNLPKAIELGAGHAVLAKQVATEITTRVASITGSISIITTEESQQYLDVSRADTSGLELLYPEGKEFVSFEAGLDETLESARWEARR